MALVSLRQLLDHAADNDYGVRDPLLPNADRLLSEHELRRGRDGLAANRLISREVGMVNVHLMGYIDEHRSPL